MPTVREAAAMIAEAYNAKKDSNGVPIQTSVNPPENWSLLNVIDNSAEGGDVAAVFVNDATKEIFIAGRGTATTNDVLPDIGIAFGQAPTSRIADASAIYSSYKNDQTYAGYTISAGGHSLDGEVWAGVSINLRGEGVDLPVLALDAPNTLVGTADDVNVLAISARYDLVGHYGATYSNSITLDTAVQGGAFNQFLSGGTHSVIRLVAEGIEPNPALANTMLGQKVDGVAVIGADSNRAITNIQLGGLSQGGSAPNETTKLSGAGDGSLTGTIVDPSSAGTIVTSIQLGAGGAVIGSTSVTVDPFGNRTTEFKSYDPTTGAVTGSTLLTPLLDEHGRLIPNSFEIVIRDGSGNILDTGTRLVNPADGSFTDTLLGSATAANPSGTVSQTTTSATGDRTAILTPTPLDQFATAANEFNDANALLQAIQHHQPLPALGSGLRLASDFSKGGDVQVLGGVGSAIGAVTSLQGLNAALRHGDISGAVVAGANLFVQGFNTYAVVAYGSVAKAAAQESLKSIAGAASAVGKALPYLQLANDLIHGNAPAAAGDAVGIAVASQLAGEGAAVAGPIGALAGFIAGQIFGDLFGDDPPPPWGAANAYWDAATGTIKVHAQGDSGGDQVAGGVLTNLVGTLHSVGAQYNRQVPAELQIGVIPERLGTINYGYGPEGGPWGGLSFNVGSIDPATGQPLNASLRFDRNTGAALNADPNDPAFFQTLGQYYINNALARGAIAPQWEVQTAEIQQANHLSNAGLSELERDANVGKLASAAAPGATTEDWNPIGLDLGGGLAVQSLSNSAVQFNVDGTADLDARLSGHTTPQFLKQTAWLNGQDGFLVLDKNLNGTVDNGEEMFSNSKVAEQMRGIASLQALDANGDGIIDATDPVFSQLRVWQDANGDGRIEAGEAHSLSDLGIAALNYRLGTYTKTDGSVHQMSTLTLQADTAGNSYQPHGDGIQITSTNGQTSLMITQVHDLSSIQANEESFTTDENLPATIAVRGNGAVQGLLDTVHVSNAPNALLNITSVGNAQHGTVSYDAQAGTVTFTPDSNYSGADASFDYQVDAGVYGQATAHVQVNVTQVDQPPRITGEQNTQLPFYGYGIDVVGHYTEGGYDVTSATVFTMRQPGLGYLDPIADPYNPGVSAVYLDQPQRYDSDPNSGDIAVTDTDDANSALSWSVATAPRYGAASVDGNGHWTYSGPGGDAFIVQVKDPSGQADQITITVPAPPPPPAPPPTDYPGGAGPIVLDLNGTGLHFESVDDSNVFFTSAQDGWRHRTAWFTGGNGVLAYDKYGDGIVHDSSQIAFKDLSSTAQTDLQGLAAFDSNHDGVIDKNDAQWGTLGVWVDANNDGVSQPGEFKTLDQLGIASISLTSNNHFAIDHGVTVHGETTFTRTDGTTGQAADITLPNSGDVLVPQPDGTDRIAQVAKADPSQPITVDDGNYLVLGNTGDNAIIAGNGNNVVETGAGNDMIQVGNGNNLIESGDGRDLIGAGDGNNTIILGAGNKYVFVGKGNNLVSGGSGNELVFAGDGNNMLYAGSGNSLLRAGNGDNMLLGGTGHNELFAGNGNNTFNDGGGIADMVAGTGNNTFIVSSAQDTITVKAGGTNTVKTDIDWTLGANQQVLWGTGRDALTLKGNDLGDQIIGNGASDTLVGGTGNDTLADSGGAAVLIGGAGDDTYIVSNAASVVVEQPGQGNDTVKTSVSYTLPANVEHLIGTGNAALTLTGGDQDGTTITANDANDTLVAGNGQVTLIGGQGDDVFVVNRSDDVVLAQAAGNDNTLRTSVSYTLPVNVEHLIGIGSAALTLTGGDQDGATITANDANDTLVAGSGQVTLLGGHGDDVFVVNRVDDVVVAQGAGNSNTIRSSVSYTASANVQSLVGTGSADITLRGNDLDDLIQANAGNDVLVAGSGFDTLVGGAGNDSYVLGNVGDMVTLGSGQSTVAGGNGSMHVIGNAAGAATITLGDGANSIDLSANHNANTVTLGNGVDAVQAGDGANIVTLGSGDDVLTLGDGDNRVATTDTAGGHDAIVVGNGANVIRVGGGNDIITTGNGANTITTGNGVDMITLGSGDNVVSVGDGNDAIIGGDGANAVTVGSGADTIALGNGNNTVSAGAGNDKITVGSGSNIINAGNGADQLLLGAGSNVVTVDDGSDTLTAHDLAGSTNAIHFGNGNSTIAVGQGNDSIWLGSGSNTVTAGDGADTVNAQDVAGSVDTITLGNGADVVNVADGNDSVTIGDGNSQISVGNGTNTLTVGNGDNRITTGCGVNAIHVGVGHDIVTNSGGTDTLYFAANVPADSLTFSQSGADLLIAEGETGGAVKVVGGYANLAAAMAQFVAGDGDYTVHLDDGSYNFRAGNGTDAVYGGSGNDNVMLSNGNDLVQLGDGGDVVTTGNGNSQIWVGNGSDRITTGDGVNAIHVGTGNQVITNNGGTDTLYFSAGVVSDTLTFSQSGSDLLVTEGTGATVRVVGGYDSLAASMAQFVAADGNYTVHLDNGSYNFAAGNGTDAVHGGNGNEKITLGNGADVVQLGSGANRVVAGNGNDVITTADLTGGGNNIVLGNGNNVIAVGEGNDSITAGNGSNTVTGGSGNSVVMLGSGNDNVALGNGANSIRTSDVAGVLDTISVGNGSNQIAVGQGNDTIIVGNGNNMITGGNGSSRITLGNAGNTVVLGNGNSVIAAADLAGATDVIAAGNGNNQITIGNGNDVLTVGDGTNVIRAATGGGDGNNAIALGRGSNSVTLGNGSNRITASDAAGTVDAVSLGNGANQILMGNGNDQIAAGNGANDVISGDGANTVTLGSGSNTVKLGNGSNTVKTSDVGGSVDTIALGDGNNTVTVGSGSDKLTLGNGNDTVSLGAGNHSLSLGNGVDAIFTNGGTDTITLGTGQYAIVNNKVNKAVAVDNVVLTHGASNQLWFQARGNDLLITVLGSSERITVENWHSGGQLHQLTAADGQTITAAGINQLVHAMARFGTPSSSQQSYSLQEQQALAPVLAANWH